MERDRRLLTSGALVLTPFLGGGVMSDGSDEAEDGARRPRRRGPRLSVELEGTPGLGEQPRSRAEDLLVELVLGGTMQDGISPASYIAPGVPRVRTLLVQLAANREAPPYAALCWAHAAAGHFQALVVEAGSGAVEPVAALLAAGRDHEAVEAAARAIEARAHALARALALALALGDVVAITARILVDGFFTGSDLVPGSILLMANGAVGVEIRL